MNIPPSFFALSGSFTKDWPGCNDRLRYRKPVLCDFLARQAPHSTEKALGHQSNSNLNVGHLAFKFSHSSALTAFSGGTCSNHGGVQHAKSPCYKAIIPLVQPDRSECQPSQECPIPASVNALASACPSALDRTEQNKGLLGVPSRTHPAQAEVSPYPIVPMLRSDGLAQSGAVRPLEILKLFWMEQIVIEETAEFLDPVYLEVA